MAAETEIRTGFDYGPDVDADTRHSLEMIAAELELEVLGVMKRIAVIGNRLMDAREKCKRVDGGFRRWIEHRCGVHPSWAYSAIQVARRFQVSHNVRHFTTRALFDLARNNVPDEAREEAVARAEAGEPIGKRVAAEIVAKHRPAAPPVIRSDADQPIEPVEDDEPEAPPPAKAPPEASVISEAIARIDAFIDGEIEAAPEWGRPCIREHLVERYAVESAEATR
jgi:hypothetical protein